MLFEGLDRIKRTVVSIFSYLASKKALIHYIYLTIGLLCGILGICLLVFEGLLTNILIWTVCIFPVISGLYGIYHALVFARRSGRKGWWILIILSLAMIVFGGFAFYNPWVSSTSGRMKVIGGTLMYSALVSGLRLIWLWPIQNREGGQSLESLNTTILNVVFAVFSCVLFMGSCVLCTTDIEPRAGQMPLISLIGFVVSVALGIYSVKCMSKKK